MSLAVEPASFRDPSGFVFRRDGVLYRQVQETYREEYDFLLASGLYDALAAEGLLIRHEEVDQSIAAAPGACRVLKPQSAPFISYPYEWCVGQLRDAALATIRIQREALRRGMSLKDASAYNIQFIGGRATLIDTLSFELYEEGRAWVAYRQFCQHFLAPLALMCRSDVRLGQLLRIHLDGIPLDLVSRLLPRSTRLDFGLLTHIHLHAAAQRRCAGDARAPDRTAVISRAAHLGLIDSLESAIQKQRWRPAGTEWADYYRETNYTPAAMDGKRRLVGEMLDAVHPVPRTVWDLGANTGRFSELAAERGASAVAWDADPAAVEGAWQERGRDGKVLPLLLDLANPSPALGWAHSERKSLVERGPAGAVMALALVHHLAIGNNVPLRQVAQFLRSIGDWLIIEFVPKSDSQVKRLLASREDVFPEYTREGFESSFDLSFETVRTAQVPESDRTLYLMRGRKPGLSGQADPASPSI